MAQVNRSSNIFIHANVAANKNPFKEVLKNEVQTEDNISSVDMIFRKRLQVLQ